MGGNILGIGLSSILAYQRALSTVSNNIANAGDANYSKRVVDLTENVYSGGVQAGTVRRIVDDQANSYVQSTGSSYYQLDTYMQRLNNFQPLFNNPDSNLGTYITDTLTALTGLNANPSSSLSRGLYLSKLNSLAAQFKSVDTEMTRQVTNSNQSISTMVGGVNQILQNIARINTQIVQTGSVDAQEGLKDRRQADIESLSQYMNVTTQTDSSGKLSITLENGIILLSGDQASQVTTFTDPNNPNNISIGLHDPIANSTTDVTQVISGGNLAGLLNYRNTVESALNTLGRVSLAFSASINTQNSLGLDASGNFGGNIFTDVNSSNAQAQRVVANSDNTGGGSFSVNIDDISDLTTSDYRLTIGASNAYTLTRLSDNTTVTGTASSLPHTVSVDGFSLTINSGTLNSGDSYTISPTKNAVGNMQLVSSDPARLALAMPINANATTTNRGSGIISLDGITDPTNSIFSTPGQLSPPLRIEFLTSTTYQIVNATSSAVIEGPLTYDPINGSDVFPTAGSYDPGFNVSLTGQMTAGDSFNLAYNSSISNDNRNGQAIADLYNTGLLQGGTLTFNQGYNQLTSDVASQANIIQKQQVTAQTIYDNAVNTRSGISGVKLEEETINLTQYQQAYQASAQVLQVAKSVFDIIFSIGRG